MADCVTMISTGVTPMAVRAGTAPGEMKKETYESPRMSRHGVMKVFL